MLTQQRPLDLRRSQGSPSESLLLIICLKTSLITNTFYQLQLEMLIFDFRVIALNTYSSIVHRCSSQRSSTRHKLSQLRPRLRRRLGNFSNIFFITFVNFHGPGSRRQTNNIFLADTSFSNSFPSGSRSRTIYWLLGVDREFWQLIFFGTSSIVLTLHLR